jgi:hypothetical protein
MKKYGFFLSLTTLLFYWQNVSAQKTDDMVGKQDKLRLIVTSDIGGTDPDDFQSMVHLMVYSDVLDLEGLISSPWGSGRKTHILSVIDAYEKDYPNLKTWSDYPTPDKLRSITKQGAIDVRPDPGWAEPTEGSKWIVECAKRPDPRPLYIANWGAIDDVAQALHDAPEIAEKIRVYWIAGPNRKRSADPIAMAPNRYMEKDFKDLWWIQADMTYRGMFNGGTMSGEWSNVNFPNTNVVGHGALGAFWKTISKQDIKMGDTPSILYYLNNNVTDPAKEGWGGAFVRYENGTNWWRDNQDPSVKEGNYFGAKTVNKWREDFLGHWKNRMDWCTEKNPNPYTTGTTMDKTTFAYSNSSLTISSSVKSFLNISNIPVSHKVKCGELLNLSGASIVKFTLNPKETSYQLNMQGVHPGSYILIIQSESTTISRVITKTL